MTANAVSSEHAARQRERVALLKQMCRLLELTRRDFLLEDHRQCGVRITRQQFVHLISVRNALPCNLSRIMKLTGMTSAGASIFVEKMVRQDIFQRTENPRDRRSVIIRFTPAAERLIRRLDDRLDNYIFSFFTDCSEEQLAVMEQAGRIVAEKLQNRA